MSTVNPNPYRDEFNDPQPLPSFAAFVDLLGYEARTRRAFKEGHGNVELRSLIAAMDEALDHLRQVENEDIYRGKRLLRVRFFTDNLVIGEPLRFLNPLAAISIIRSYLAWFQMRMARSGYFMRGAISFGELYVDDEIVFGPALLEAVDGEKKLAHGPRIILCRSASKALRDAWNDDYGGVDSYPIPGWLIGPDGYPFIDYLEDTVMIAYPDAGPFSEILREHKEQIEKAFKEHERSPDIRAKYEWLAAYHNHFCKRYPGLFGLKEFINEEFLSTRFVEMVFPGCESELRMEEETQP